MRISKRSEVKEMKNREGVVGLETKLFSPRNMVSRKVGSNRYLLLDPDRPFWMSVNKRGKEILELCNGGRKLATVARILSERNGDGYEDVAKSILPFVRQVHSKGFLSESPFEPPRPLDRDGSGLKELWVHITNFCNLRCIHCHVTAGVPLKDELCPEEFFRVIDSFANLGGKRLVFTGGEPLARRVCLDAIEYAHKNGIKNLDLITNGILITNEIARRLRDACCNVQLSLDGAKRETNDKIRGMGSYHRAITGLKKLLNAGVNTRLAMTVMKTNMGEIIEIAELSRSFGLKVVHFPFLQMKGRAKTNGENLALSYQDYMTAWETIARIPKEVGIKVSFEESFEMSIKRAWKRDLCGAGCGMLSLASNGDVYPCAGLHEDEFRAGNVRDSSLEEIHRCSSALKEIATNSVLRIPKCSGCELKFLCGGGCHVDTYFAYGRLDRATPRCQIMKAIYWKALKEVAQAKTSEERGGD